MNTQELFFFRGNVYSYSKDGFSLYEGVSDVPVTDEGLLPSKEVERRVKYIQGKVLTVIDAVILDKEQKKAVKVVGELQQPTFQKKLHFNLFSCHIFSN